MDHGAPAACTRIRATRRGAWLAAFAVLTSGGQAADPALQRTEEPSTHEHVPLDLDEALGWDLLLEHTVANSPTYVELEAREAEARAWKSRSRSLLAAQPSVGFSFLSDQRLDDHGLAEYSAGVSLPLWRAGQRSAAGHLSESAEREAAAAEAALVWEIAGRLRQALWDIVDAANGAELAQEALSVARETERVVERRYAAGDLPLEDTLRAHTFVLEREAALVQRRAELIDAERAYESLTGLYARPAEFAEEVSMREDFDETHPLLALLGAQVMRARAELEFASRQSRGNTVVTIGPRRQRDPFSDFYTDSFGLDVAIPFGGKAHSATVTSAVARRVAEAEAARAAALRALNTALHESRHTLDVTEIALALGEGRAQIADRHWRLGQVAFEEGEITLQDLLLREDAARAAAREAARLSIMRGRTVAELNQALGELP